MSATNPSAFQSNSPNPAKVSRAPNDLTGTDDALDTDALASDRTAPTHASKPQPNKRPATKKAAKSARKRSRRAEEPTMTVEEAIAKGRPSDEIKALIEDWSRFKLQEARDQAKAATQALAAAAKEGRRVAADELLSLADGYGCSMDEAKEILKEALVAKFDSKVKGK